MDSVPPTTSSESVADSDTNMSYSCARCNATKKTKAKMKKHVKKYHPFICAVCGDEFGTIEKRDDHIRDQHDL